MKKGTMAWETIVKLIIILIVFVILITLTFIFKERLFDLLNSLKSALTYRGH